MHQYEYGPYKQEMGMIIKKQFLLTLMASITFAVQPTLLYCSDLDQPDQQQDAQYEKTTNLKAFYAKYKKEIWTLGTIVGILAAAGLYAKFGMSKSSLEKPPESPPISPKKTIENLQASIDLWKAEHQKLLAKEVELTLDQKHTSYIADKTQRIATRKKIEAQQKPINSNIEAAQKKINDLDPTGEIQRGLSRPQYESPPPPSSSASPDAPPSLSEETVESLENKIWSLKKDLAPLHQEAYDIGIAKEQESRRKQIAEKRESLNYQMNEAEKKLNMLDPTKTKRRVVKLGTI